MLNNNITIRYVQNSDKDFWFTLDKHLSIAEFDKKVCDKQGYVLLKNNCPIGILRYNLFWDNTPFCTLLYVEENFQRQGYGAALMNYWEKEMLSLEHAWVLTSTQIDETSQHFYRKLGYVDCGSLNVPNQPAELFLIKRLS